MSIGSYDSTIKIFEQTGERPYSKYVADNNKIDLVGLISYMVWLLLSPLGRL